MAELELRHLRTVRAVFEAGSLSRAAIRLGVSQPALTAQLKRIERILGGKLFERGPSGAVPTPLGQFVLDRAEALLADLDALVGIARERGSVKPAALRIGSLPALMLSGFVAQLHETKQWADIRTIIEQSMPIILRLLATGRVDVALFERFEGMEPSHLSGLTVRTLTHEPVFVALSVEHPAADSAAIDLADLADCDWVVPPPHENSMRGAHTAACEAAGYTPRLRHFTSDSSIARTLIKRGAVALMQAGAREDDGFVIRPLKGTPIVAEIMFGLRVGDPLAEQANELFACAARAYRADVDSNPYFQAWWAEHPELHAELDAALAE